MKIDTNSCKDVDVDTNADQQALDVDVQRHEDSKDNTERRVEDVEVGLALRDIATVLLADDGDHGLELQEDWCNGCGELRAIGRVADVTSTSNGKLTDHGLKLNNHGMNLIRDLLELKSTGSPL